MFAILFTESRLSKIKEDIQLKYTRQFSLITIVNKEPVYQEFKKNLDTQVNVDYELIKIDNSDNQFNSARAAYNDAAKKANGEYLVFLHPDIRFLDKNALSDILNEIKKLPNLGVAGIAGSPQKLVNNDRQILTTIVQGADKESVGTLISKTEKVQTLDECFFVVKHEWLDKHPFTECKGWHFYAVEQSLIALLDHKDNYVVPARVWHTSAGASEDYRYVLIGRQMVKRYGEYFPSINTTVRKWDTKGIKANINSSLYLVKRVITTYLRK